MSIEGYDIPYEPGEFECPVCGDDVDKEGPCSTACFKADMR